MCYNNYIGGAIVRNIVIQTERIDYMNALINEINLIKEQVVSHYAPSKIILFGSQAKGMATKKSDIDLCIVKDTENKRDLLIDMYLNIRSSKPFDLILYTEAEWRERYSCFPLPTGYRKVA